QGDQVVKSPWSSWQFGMNYLYHNWSKAYKGRGDKSEKYLYEEIFTRSNNFYERYVSPLSDQYSSFSINSNATSASSNNRNGLISGYGLVRVKQVEEPIVDFDVSAGVRPKQVVKGTITIADKNPVTPTQPEAIEFNTPSINIIPPTAVTITATAPTMTAPTVTAPTVTTPNLPTTLSFSPVTPSITAPTAPTVKLSTPPSILFNGTGFGQPNGASIPKSNIIMQNWSTYTPTGTINVQIEDSSTTWSGGNVNVNLIGGSSNTLNPGTTTTPLNAFISHVDDIDVDVKGTYNITSSKSRMPLFISLNPYMVGTYSAADKTFKLSGNLNMSTTGSGGIVGIEYQLLAGQHSGNVALSNVNNGTTTIILETSGNINMTNGKNMIGVMIDTEYFYDNNTTYFKKKPKYVNSGKITIDTNASNSIGIDFGYYRYKPNSSNENVKGPNTDVKVGNIIINGSQNYGYRQKDYTKQNNPPHNDGLSPQYYDAMGTVDGSTGVIILNGSNNVAYSIAQGKSTGDPIANFTAMQVEVNGKNNVGFLRNSDTSTINITAITLDDAKLGNTFKFGTSATGGALIRSDIHEIILDKDITVGATGIQNSLMQAGKAGKVTLASGKSITSTSSDEFYGMTAGNFTGATDGKKAKVLNDGTLNIGGNKSLGMAIDVDDEGTNNGEINFSGTNGAGVYNTGTFTAENSSEINVSGKSSIGAYNSKMLTINSGAKITGTAEDSTGIYATAGTATNNGTISMNGTSVKGLVVGGAGANITNNNTVSVTGKEAVGAAALQGTITTAAGSSITADGTSGIALYAGGTVGGTIEATGGTVEAKNGAINVYADKGTIKFSGATVKTEASSLAFMQSSNGGTVDFSSATTADIATNGTAFYIPPATTPSTVTYTPFTGISSITGFNNLNNLTLNMSPNSNLAVASYVRSNVSDLGSASLGSLGANILGTGYNDYLLYKSELTANAGTTYADFKKIALSNSSIINDTTLSTTDSNVNLMAQENTETDKDWVKLINNATIELKGTNSLAMYASNGKIKNAAGASITVGNTGVAIYGSNKGSGDTDIENSGNITVGESSTAIYAKDYKTTGLKNNGTITLAGDKGIGMSYVSKLSSSTTVENEGTISGTASKGTGMYVAKDANSVRYTALNSNKISLGASGVGIYTNATSTGTNLLENTGTITVGDNGIGLYGYEEKTTGNVTAGKSGIALYSQGGSVDIGSASTNPTITVGDTKATAVFTTGSGQTITSTNAKYNIGATSYGFVNTGSGNTLNIAGGVATLTGNGVFIYSSDTTGNITNATAITSTGSIGSNFGVYSAGTVTNTGNITLTHGTGNVGVYAINNGNITNSGTITLGASTTATRSIGAIANTGTVTNDGNIVVNGQYGIGTYSTGNSTINNSGDITLTGDETIGNYGASGSNMNVSSGTVTLTGNKSTGYYLDGGTGSTIASGAKIDVSGNEASGVYVNNNGSLAYSGATTVSGDAAYGFIVDGNSTVTATGGTLTINGTSGMNGTSSSANANRGSAALVVTSGSSLTGNNLDVTADIAGENSVGVYSAGNLAIDSANISAYDSGVNFFTAGGTISIGNNGGTSTVITGTGANKGALLFYTPSGNILLNGIVNATVQGSTDTIKRGTAFYYTGGGTLGTISSYTPLNPTNIATWARSSYGNGGTSTLGKLNLTMNQDSRLFLTERVNMELSNTSATNLFSGLSVSERPHITGSNFRTFMLYHSHLNVNQAVNLDNANDEYNLMEISSSAITNNNTITGTQAGQIAMAQENDTTTKAVVTLTNHGTIDLSGLNSAGIYGKNAIIHNANKITVGNSSSGIYGLNNTEISNTGNITTGASSTAIYYSDVEKDSAGNITAVKNTTTGLKNAGTIVLNGDDSVGLTYEPGNISGTVTFENTADITSSGDKNVGMFAKRAQNGASYDMINQGSITLGNSASLSNPNVAMYTNATSIGSNPLKNMGNITVGDYSVAMYGFEENSSGNIKVGNGSIGLYSKNGNVNVSGSITTGSSKESVGVYTVGSGQTITSTGSTFNLGDTSFGFVNIGNNTITSTGGSATLSNNATFIYSSDETSHITNSTNISSSGAIGRNYGIYASGIVDNSGNIDFGSGVGNLGIYMVKGGKGTNTATITVGASDVTNELFGVGMAAGYIGDATTAPTTGTVENQGTINVNGPYSIGMYGAKTGTIVTNKHDIILNASNTTGIYVEEGAKAINDGTIKTGASGLSNVNGVVLGSGSTLENNGTINIAATASNGVLLKGGTIANYGSITVSGSGSEETKLLNSTPTSKGIGSVVIEAPAGATTATITAGGVVVTPTIVSTTARNPISVSADSIGLYVNTSGKDFTSSITGLGHLTSQADLIIGTEAAASTISKYIQIKDNKILDPYNNAILSSGVSKWNVYSGSLGWITTPTLDPGTGKVTNLYMAKIPYTEWSKNQDTYNFTDGLEQRYGVEELETRENQLFQKLNSIGNNEEVLLYQAFDEMMGHQYANVQQRIQATASILDKELKYLKKEWDTKSKDSNKIKAFGMRGEYKTDTAGVMDYSSHAQGFAYLHEKETVQLGNTTGWYA
ncbi:hypothetical protein, partial [Fusobacterium necrophorum]|uniref:hypothetical protein n=4 Tax=Fusobacterium necrophorum TaxID=859 RepID=UPI00068D1387